MGLPAHAVTRLATMTSQGKPPYRPTFNRSRMIGAQSLDVK